jgi:outer membrane protein assembly factor BamB
MIPVVAIGALPVDKDTDYALQAILMNSKQLHLAFSIGIVLFLSGAAVNGAEARNWPQFRGPLASGVSDSAEPPLTWDVEAGTNVRWQQPIPGLAHASPIIWERRVYIATVVKPGRKPKLRIGLYGDGDSYAEKEPHQWRLLCLDSATGKILWNKLGHEAVPRLERHTKATQCNSTPATDGQRIVALFGSEGLFCFDMQGELRWRKDLGKLHAAPYDVPTYQWGFASSPILHEGKVIVQVDTISDQYLAVFEASDGRELWRRPRKDNSSWCAPIVAKTGGRTQIIANGWKEIGGYNFKTGAPLWWLSEGGDVPVASPILAGERVILTSGHGKYRPMRAVRLDASGNIQPPEISMTNQAIAWCHPRKGNYLQTPIVVGDLLWGCTNDGIVTCFDPQSGRVYYEERIGGGGQGFTASPVASKRHLYFTGELGDVFVLPATNRFSVVSTNKLGGLCLSTPAMVDDTILFRTTEKLVAVGTSRAN